MGLPSICLLCLLLLLPHSCHYFFFSGRIPQPGLPAHCFLVSCYDHCDILFIFWVGIFFFFIFRTGYFMHERLPSALRALSIRWKSPVWCFLPRISLGCVFRSSFYLCVPVAICGCCFCLLCPDFTEHKQGWDMQPDRESQSFRPAPGDAPSWKTFLNGFLPTLTFPACKCLCWSLLGTKGTGQCWAIQLLYVCCAKQSPWYLLRPSSASCIHCLQAGASLVHLPSYPLGPPLPLKLFLLWLSTALFWTVGSSINLISPTSIF